MKRMLLCGFFMFTLVGASSAQLTVDKGKTEFTIQPGQQISDKLTVTNTASQPVDIKIYMEDMLYKEPFAGGKEFYPAGALKEHSNAEWVDISPRQVTLPAGGKRDISFNIKVPPDVKGGYYGVMIFENDSSKLENTAHIGLKLVMRVGSLIFLETKESIRKLNLGDFKLENSGITFSAKNEGDVISIFEISYYAMDQEGSLAGRDKLNKTYLPPGKETKKSIPVLADLKSGDYTYVVNIDLGRGELQVREIDIHKDAQGAAKILEVRE